MKNVTRLLKEVKVYDCGFTKIRIGNEYDGGYVALKEICEMIDTVISIGVEDDVSFDLDFVEKFPQARIILYDHTVDSLPVEHENFTFFKRGVGPKKKKNIETLDTITADVNNRSLLKMDIEWAEWETLLSTSDDTLEKFAQMLIEFHLVHVDTDEIFMLSKDKLTPYFNNFYKTIYNSMNERIFGMYSEVLRKLRQHFYIFHISANNSLSRVTVDGHSFPPLLELSFVRKDMVRNISKTTTSFPIADLDFPNKPYKDDIVDFYPLA